MPSHLKKIPDDRATCGVWGEYSSSVYYATPVFQEYSIGGHKYPLLLLNPVVRSPHGHHNEEPLRKWEILHTRHQLQKCSNRVSKLNRLIFPEAS
ncbi:hypothetical protein [Microcoleus sp. B3-A4]|uniref:hypothetical protein n=1 Tax=Microcoleus sp. B3-A4 TaxID=2818653 RepID=UPI002FD2C8F0